MINNQVMFTQTISLFRDKLDKFINRVYVIYSKSYYHIYSSECAQKYSIRRYYIIMLKEFKVEELPMGVVKTGKYEIDPHSHDFNFFTMNGRAFPFTTPLVVKHGENIKIRLANAMEKAHHIHKHQFIISAADGNIIDPRNRMKKEQYTCSIRGNMGC
ncbi:MAG: hypothetical protein LLF98_04505 [Clostridium sp.]|uniref:hypothetical protein n=1 Tax=Clostridium sp. TaxID=1506 RepID=UPI0025BA62C8|nr:hypothetical protein [Clostridium sp.]MCE5220536.1 hypothetical protein [Clostridium sp.]